MTQQLKLSKAQALIVAEMEAFPAILWWAQSLDEWSRNDLDYLVEADILLLGENPHQDWWRLKRRPLMPEQKQIVETMQKKAGQNSWKADDLPGDLVDLATLEEEGIIETVYRLTVKGLDLPF
ncbi:MAG: hypothetical protein V3R81_15370 [Gammaproteobacteria bacterium]